MNVTHARSSPLERTWWKFARKHRRIDGREVRIFEESVLPETLRLDLVVRLAFQLHGWSGRATRFAAAVSCAPSGLGSTASATADVGGVEPVVPRRTEVSEVAKVGTAAAAAAVGCVFGDGGGAARTVNNRASGLHR